MNETTSVARTVAPFNLERFEVTQARFLTFLLDYDRGRAPREGSGAAPADASSGWQREWSEDPMLVSPSASSLMTGMAACGATFEADNGSAPVTCINWYVALAFCIWDGARLPTEAEWTFAAMAGEEQLPYPWSSAPYDASIDWQHACYKDQLRACEQLAPVGSYAKGAGKWRSLDLAGNAVEWVLDPWQENLGDAPCQSEDSMSDCAADVDGSRRAVKGGSYLTIARFLLNATRSWAQAAQRDSSTGFRCVRDVDPISGVQPNHNRGDKR